MKLIRSAALILVLFCTHGVGQTQRARDWGIEIGVLPPGPLNAITDVEGVRVGHVTLIQGDSVRTGVTAIIPHAGNLFRQKVRGAVFVGNGFGKLIGSTQVQELGQIETPVLLTNTLSVWDVANGVVDYVLGNPENADVRSVNPVVGETNDGFLNDIRGRHVSRSDALKALEAARSGPVQEGSVGAGTGTVCFGWKGGIGTSSRRLSSRQGGYTVGVLVQTNYGGNLDIAGVPVGKELDLVKSSRETGGGSCMIVVATDAPLTVRQLERLAARPPLALGRSGSSMSHGSGDYVIAFATGVTLETGNDVRTTTRPELNDNFITPLFQAAVEATEEAIVNSLLSATDMKGFGGRTVQALPGERVKEILRKYGRIR